MTEVTLNAPDSTFALIGVVLTCLVCIVLFVVAFKYFNSIPLFLMGMGATLGVAVFASFIGANATAQYSKSETEELEKALRPYVSEEKMESTVDEITSLSTGEKLVVSDRLTVIEGREYKVYLIPTSDPGGGWS